jgi:hypothetical protein
VVRGQHGLNEENLAELSCRCTKWATELATEEAARDFLHAYHDEEEQEQQQPGQRNHHQHQQQQTCFKRAADETVEDRRVRPRLAFPALR